MNKRLAGGCHLTRRISEDIERAGFAMEKSATPKTLAVSGFGRRHAYSRARVSMESASRVEPHCDPNRRTAMMRQRVLPSLVVLAALAACSSGAKPKPQAPSTAARHAVVAAPAPTTTTSMTDTALGRYNPTHDPTKCVRLLPNGQVVFVEILLVPGKPKPAYVNGAKCG